MSLNFKYIKVVDDNSNKVVNTKKQFYKVLNLKGIDGISIILPTNGVTEEDAAQQFLFDNQRDYGVYVRTYSPESKYEFYEDILHRKNTSFQLKLMRKQEKSEREAKELAKY